MSATNDEKNDRKASHDVVAVSSLTNVDDKSELQSESLWWPDIEDEELKIFVVSYSLQSLTFYALWDIMPSLGWKYFSSKEYKYESPHYPLQWHHTTQGKLLYKKMSDPNKTNQRRAISLHFKNSKELQECLDHKHSYIPPPNHFPELEETFYEIRTRQLREDLLKVLFIRMKRKQSKIPTISIPTKNHLIDIPSLSNDRNVDENDSDPKSVTNDQQTKLSSIKMLHDNLIQTKKRSFTSIEKGAEVYFEKRKVQRNPNTDKLETIDMLQNISPQAAVAAVQKNPQYYEKEIEKLHESKRNQFTQWRSLLSNHSLLFYGFGSKQTLLQEFAEEELVKDGDILTLHGYDRDFSIKKVLNLILFHFLNGRDPYEDQNTYRYDPNQRISSGAIYPPSLASTDAKRAVALAQALSTRSRPIYILLHNIDGIQLRDLETQECLSYLTAHSVSNHSNNSRSIRLVASVDHINASVSLWNAKTLFNFSWIWRAVSNYTPYHNEVFYGASYTPTETQKHTKHFSNAAGIINVLKSLAPRHAEVLQDLASLQLNSKKKFERNVIEYKTLLHSCQRKMFISSDMNLRNIVQELSDHNIVEIQRDEKGIEIISIKESSDILETIIAFQC